MTGTGFMTHGHVFVNKVHTSSVLTFDTMNKHAAFLQQKNENVTPRSSHDFMTLSIGYAHFLLEIMPVS